MRASGDIGPLPIRGAKSRAFAAVLALIVAAALFAIVTGAAYAVVASLPGMTKGWTRVVSAGFTDPNNSMSPYVTEFNGYLYLAGC
jgi:hypothetical protein